MLPQTFGVAEKLRFGSKFTAAFGRPMSGNSFSLEVHPKLDINTAVWSVAADGMYIFGGWGEGALSNGKKQLNSTVLSLN